MRTGKFPLAFFFLFLFPFQSNVVGRREQQTSALNGNRQQDGTKVDSVLTDDRRLRPQAPPTRPGKQSKVFQMLHRASNDSKSLLFFFVCCFFLWSNFFGVSHLLVRVGLLV